MPDQSVLLLSADKALGSQLRAALEGSGVRLWVLESPALLSQRAWEAEPLMAVIVDFVSPKADNVGSLLRDLRALFGPIMPILCVMESAWLHARVAALRAGAARCLLKPVAESQLSDALAEIAEMGAEAPMRVLVVDDDEAVAQYHAHVLIAQGFEVRVLCDPLQVLNLVGEFCPDVLLLDMYMPDLSGLEVVALLREDDKYISLPIVFLSVESQFERQLAALSWGGDEFLSKPIAPAQLVTVVSARARRARRANRVREQIQVELREAQFQQQALDAHAIVSVANAVGDITYVNEAFCRISGYSPEELLGRNHRVLKSGLHESDFYAGMWEAISSGETWHGTICNRRKDGSPYWVESTIAPFLDSAGLPYQYVSVRTDVTPLVQARDEAGRANLAKAEFLASMSHELRTPLNAVLGFTQLLENNPDEPLSDLQRDYTGHILKAGWHLLDMVTSVLDLAKIEQGGMVVALELVDLVGVARDALAQTQAVADEFGVSIVCQFGCQPAYWVQADAPRLKQCVLSLLTNAIKYNHRGGEVRIDIGNVSGRTRLSVIDTGRGMTDEQLTRLFRPFDRLVPMRGEVAGAGVGLALTRELLKLMGAEIGVRSEPGVGSDFWVDLPAPAPAEDVLLAGETLPVKPVDRPVTILHLDASPVLRVLVRELLSRWTSVTLISSHSGRLGLDLVRKYQPDLLILDAELADIDAYHFLTLMREAPEADGIPVLALSTQLAQGDLDRATSAGIDAILVKPIRRDEFFGAVQALLTGVLADGY